MRPRRHHHYRRRGAAAAFLSPALALIGVFTLIPIVLTLWISLHDWSMFTPFGQMKWVGLANYENLLHDSGYRAALRNTVVYVGLSVLILVPLSLLLGMVLHFPRVAGRTVLRTILFASYVIPTVAVAIIWGALYAPNYGPAGRIVAFLGLGSPQWLSSPSTALLSLVIFNVWQMIGYYTILIVAGLTTIPEEIYEAARIDGAGVIVQTRRITVPLLRRTLTFVAMMTIINAVQIFDPVYVLTQGGPANSTDTLSYEIQRRAFQFGDAGQASAMAFSLLVLLALVVATVGGLARIRR
jgi:multiple sugar transport system permease protein